MKQSSVVQKKRFRYAVVGIISVICCAAFSPNAVAEPLDKAGRAEAYGKDIFIKYGIDDDLPKQGLSSLLQGEHLVEYAQRTLQVGDDSRQSSVYLVKHTDAKGNIYLRMKYNPEEFDDRDDAIEEIEKHTRTEYLLRGYSQSYDPSTVKAVEHQDGLVEITFKYSKYGLPQDIAYFRFLEVKIEVQDGQPKRIVISNSRPFSEGKYNVESYKQEILFTQLATGKFILKRKHTQASGTTYGNKPVKLVTTVEPVALYEEDAEMIILDEVRLSEVSDPRIREEKIDIHRTFPLMGDMVRRKGIDLPLPFGVSMTYRSQDMEIPFSDFNIMGQNLNDIFSPEGSLGSVTAESLTVRGDVNILPFWNVFGFVGKIDVEANVDAAYTGAIGESVRDKLNDKFSGLGNAFCKEVAALCNQGNVSVPLHLEYDVMGAGTTLSVGYNEFFGSVTGSYATTRLKGSDNWGDGIISLQPMLGYQFLDYRAQLFVGAEYQGLKPYLSGKLEQIEIAGEEFEYNVGVNMNKWAYLVGFNKQIGKNYNISVLYNKGETRSSTTLNLGYRF